MTSGLFDYPKKAAFGRVLPKSKVYAFGKASRRMQNLFAAEVAQIVWRFKLAPETINIPAGPDVAEIQIFGVELKPGVGEASRDVFACIDHAIAFPIIFEVTAPSAATQRIKVVAAFKRPSEADSAKWVVGDYFATEWLPEGSERSPLPVALTLTGLYEQMIRGLVPLTARPGESLQGLVERHAVMAMKRREMAKLEAQLKREKQFNRKVELNARLRTVKDEVDALVDGGT